MFKREPSASNDLVSVELVNDSLMKFDQVWEETLMALDKTPAADLLEGLDHRQLVKASHAKYPGAMSFPSISPRHEAWERHKERSKKRVHPWRQFLTGKPEAPQSSRT